MPRPSYEMRRATLSDSDAVVRVLVRSFDTDPAAKYLLRQDAGRARGYEACFRAFFEHMCLPHGEVWMDTEARGTALWTPPGRWDVGLQRIRMLPSLIRAVGVSRLLFARRAAAETQKHHPHEPHFYLFALGVDPDHQGRGVGSALLEKVLVRCDELGTPAYLEASTVNSARLYERHGFVGKEELFMAEGAPPIWPMWREPMGKKPGAGVP
jgi:ribosomal protein S18 acetylase RimI-like enzyme